MKIQAKTTILTENMILNGINTLFRKYTLLS